MAARNGLMVLLAAAIASCTSVDLEQRRAAAAIIAPNAGWQRLNLDAAPFVLAAFVPPDLKHTDTLTIYIEGDGLAWMDASTPSLDPTPLDPVALRMALHDASRGAVYLARPCQYVTADDRRNCDSNYWTSFRFSPAVIDASNSAIEQLKAKYSAQKIELVGYSGGGAVAALVAANRRDVMHLTTVAGNLDHVSWTTAHKLTPLTGSLNAADFWPQLVNIPQRHYVGGRDETVGEFVARAYASHFPPDHQPQIIVIPEYDHHCCWEKLPP